jgi:hypothetical protein
MSIGWPTARPQASHPSGAAPQHRSRPHAVTERRLARRTETEKPSNRKLHPKRRPLPNCLQYRKTIEFHDERAPASSEHQCRCRAGLRASFGADRFDYLSAVTCPRDALTLTYVPARPSRPDCTGAGHSGPTRASHPCLMQPTATPTQTPAGHRTTADLPNSGRTVTRPCQRE